jgi:hypothetical protein
MNLVRYSYSVIPLRASYARALSRPGTASTHLFLLIDNYCNNLRISWGCWLACANTEMPACSNTFD